MRVTLRIVAGTILSKGRVAGLGAVALLGVLLALAVRGRASVDAELPLRMLSQYELSLLVPVVSLVLGAAAFGDLVDDRTLVYLWLRPIARWRVVLGAWTAAFAGSLVFAVLPTTVAAAMADGGGTVVAAALVAATVGALGYTSMFLLLGLLVRRALVWGLAYLLIWEQFVARSGSTAARLSILVNARSLLYRLSDFPPPALSPATGFGAAAPVLVGLAALALTALALRRVEIS